MAKRCKYSDKETGTCSCEKFYRDKDGISHCVMNPYTTDNCYMKRKPKLRRVKAWAVITTVMPKDGTLEYKEVRRASIEKDKRYVNVPCTILIDEKYLRGDK